MMIKNALRGFLLALFAVYSPVLFADSPSVENPVTLLQGTINTLQAEIGTGAHAQALEKNPQALYDIVKKNVIPLVNINQMSALALGPKWRMATPQEQQTFIDEFGFLLTKAYAGAIVNISNYKITLNPLRGNAWQTAQYVAVTGQVTSRTNDQSSTLTYYLERSGNSWQIYDLAIEGVSFLKNYQQQFQSFQDMPALLSKLKTLNLTANQE